MKQAVVVKVWTSGAQVPQMVKATRHVGNQVTDGKVIFLWIYAHGHMLSELQFGLALKRLQEFENHVKVFTSSKERRYIK